MTTLVIFLTGVLVVVTCLPLSSHPHWSVRGLDFPRLQFGLLAIALLPVQLIFLDSTAPLTMALIVLTSACLCWQAWWIFPYSSLWPQEMKSAKSFADDSALCILTANVLTSNRDATRLVHLVRNHGPDVLVTLESDQWWEDQLAELEDEMPHTIKCPLDNLYGMHVYSRLPLTDTETVFLVEDDVPSMHARIRLPCGDQIRMHFLHPAPPSPTENPESAERDAELVIVARSVAEEPGPVIVTGDLNDVAWSSTTRLFRKISGLLDPRVGRGMFNTFHAGFPFLRWPLDHLFASEHFKLISIVRLPSIGSDHFPLLTRLAYAPGGASDQEGLDTDAGDRARADTIAAEKGVERSDVPEPGRGARSVPEGCA